VWLFIGQFLYSFYNIHILFSFFFFYKFQRVYIPFFRLLNIRKFWYPFSIVLFIFRDWSKSFNFRVSYLFHLFNKKSKSHSPKVGNHTFSLKVVVLVHLVRSAATCLFSTLDYLVIKFQINLLFTRLFHQLGHRLQKLSSQILLNIKNVRQSGRTCRFEITFRINPEIVIQGSPLGTKLVYLLIKIFVFQKLLPLRSNILSNLIVFRIRIIIHPYLKSTQILTLHLHMNIILFPNRILYLNKIRLTVITLLLIPVRPSPVCSL
jgi:hypothetical protein